MCTDGAGCNPHFPIYGKKQLEAKIIKIAAELFPFVHTNNTSCVEFLTLRTKLADAVWHWALVTFAVIPLPENKRRKWKQLCSDASHYGKDIEHPETQAWLAKRTGYAVSEIAQLME